jgi:ABC-2 type transport system ATP-binding protein
MLPAGPPAPPTERTSGAGTYRRACSRALGREGPLDNAITIRGLRKTFGQTVALDALDLEVATGEVHGFVGPNGSGKSTTIRVLLGLLRADAGDVVLLGGDPWRDTVALHRRLAYVPGEVGLWPQLSGGEAIDLLGRLRGGFDPARKAELLTRFELDPTKTGRSYSKGNRQKVALVAALAADVELLILDEPTSGLDPLMESVFQRCIEEAKGAGRTVLLSSHILSEVEALCDRVSILRQGRVVQRGTLDELRRVTRTNVVATLERMPVDLDGWPGVHDPLVHDNRLRCDVETPALTEFMGRLTACGIVSLVTQPPTLEELFLREYSDERS